MSCAVAISKSPVFSPSSSSSSSSLFCLSPETLSLINSPLRLHKPPPPSGLIRSSNDLLASPQTSSFSKRKRPAKLDIPPMNLGFGGTDSETAAAAGERRRETVEEEADGYSVFSKRGRRAAMEDRFSTQLNVNGDPKHACFGIYDGHGGAEAADFAAKNLIKNIVDRVENLGDGDVVEAVKQAYLKTDSDFLKEDIRGGSCCVTAIIWKGDLVVSNAGDCRAVVSRCGVAEALTSDHRPSREDEKTRIEALGGYVDSCHGVWRIQGSLAVSRGIGDRHLKQWVIAEPETKVVRIEPDLEFVILASDGLWDKVSNQEAVDVARTCCIGTNKIELLSACKKLAVLSMSRGSADDTSVMIIRLGNFC